MNDIDNSRPSLVLSTRLLTHPEMALISAEAFGLWVRAQLFCLEQCVVEIPEGIARMLADDDLGDVAFELVNIGVWEESQENIKNPLSNRVWIQANERIDTLRGTFVSSGEMDSGDEDA